MIVWPTKDPDEVLDYELDWADPLDPRLQTGETLLTSSWSVAQGDLVIEDTEFSDTLSTVWVSGGTLGTKCVLTNEVTTSGGRTYDQSATIRIRAK